MEAINMEGEKGIKDLMSENAIYTGIALALFGLTTLIYNILVGRIYGAATLGLVNTAISTVFLFAIFVAFFRGASSKIVAEYRGRQDTESANYLMAFSLLFTILLGLISIVILLIIKNNLITTFNLTNTIFFWIVILIPLRALFDVFRNMYYGTFRVKQYLNVLIFSTITFFITLAFFYFMSLPLLLPFILMYLIFSLISIYTFRGNFDFKVSKEIRRKVQRYAFSYASFAIIGNASGVVMSHFGVMVSAMYLNFTQVGYFSAANSLLSVLNYIPAILPYALSPIISYEFGKNNINGIKIILNRTARIWAVALGLITGLAIIYSRFFLDLFYGSEYLPAVLPLSILIISFYFNSIIIPLISTLSGTKYIFISSSLTGVLSFIVGTTAFIYLIPNYGIVGTALSIAIVNFITLIVVFYFSRILFDFEIRNVFYPFVMLVLPVILVLSLFINNEIYLYTIGGPSFAIFYLLSNKKVVIYLYDELKKQLKVRI